MIVWNSVETRKVSRNKLQAPAQTSKLCTNLRLYMLHNLIIEAKISTFPRPSPKSAVQWYGGSGRANFDFGLTLQSSKFEFVYFTPFTACSYSPKYYSVTTSYFLELNGIPCLSLLYLYQASCFSIATAASFSCDLYGCERWVVIEYMFITLERFKGGIGRRILKLSRYLAVPILLSSYLFCSISHR